MVEGLSCKFSISNTQDKQIRVTDDDGLSYLSRPKPKRIAGRIPAS